MSIVVVVKPSLKGGQCFSLLSHHDHVVELVCFVFRKAHSLDLKSLIDRESSFLLFKFSQQLFTIWK